MERYIVQKLKGPTFVKMYRMDSIDFLSTATIGFIISDMDFLYSGKDSFAFVLTESMNSLVITNEGEHL